jgi:hypothetical protein
MPADATSSAQSHTPPTPADGGLSEGGFPASRGPEIAARDIRVEEDILEQILGSLDERRARFDEEIVAEMTQAIDRLGIDWGHESYRDRYDSAAREELLRSALGNPGARGVVRDYVAHLQEHRAEFLARVLRLTETKFSDA